MTDRELDALVAEKVMGMWREPWNDEPDHWWQRHSDGTSKMHASVKLLGAWTCHSNSLPKFSTKLDAAWLVVEEMRRKGWATGIEALVVEPGPSYYAVVCGRGSSDGAIHVRDESAPRAICIAALRALGVEVQP